MKPETALSSWEHLNTYLRTCSEAEACDLLNREKNEGRRVAYLLRIHATMNRRRTRRERAELRKLATE